MGEGAGECECVRVVRAGVRCCAARSSSRSRELARCRCGAACHAALTMTNKSPMSVCDVVYIAKCFADMFYVSGAAPSEKEHTMVRMSTSITEST